MSKKDTARPRFICPKCGCSWVYHEPYCIVCGAVGKPLNARAERIIRRINMERVDNEQSVRGG